MSGPGEEPAAHLVDTGGVQPVLLLHGWGASGELWAPLRACLAPEFRLIIPDLPGFGATSPPPRAWCLDDYADWVTALLNRLGLERVDIVAHSFGGRIAIRLAARQPALVGRLVLAASAGIRPRRGPVHHLRVQVYRGLRRLTRLEMLPSAARRWADAQARRRGSADYRAATGTMRGTFVRIVNEDLRPILPAVVAPTLLIWGAADEETPLAHARVMERLIPDAGLVVISGSGHYAYVEQFGRFCRIVGPFLRGDSG